MTQEVKTTVFVGGIYNWPVYLTKEERYKNKNYPRYNWVDIDTKNIENYNQVLAVFKKYKVGCISQNLGKGYHFMGDLVPFDLWMKIWGEAKPYADPLWAPHTIRISRKRKEEIFDKPIFHDSGSGIQPWMKSVMHFLCKVIRNENESNLWNAMHDCGIQKYFQGTVYPVELK